MKDEQFLAFHYWNSLRTAAQVDLTTACRRFHVDLAMAKFVAGLSIPDLNRLALEVELVVLRPVVTSEQLNTILGPSRLPNAARICARLMVGTPSGRTRASSNSNPAKTGDINNGNADSKARRHA